MTIFKWKKKVIQGIFDTDFSPSSSAAQCLCCAVNLENTSNTFFIAHLAMSQLKPELHCFPVLVFGVKSSMLTLCLKSHPINYIVHYFGFLQFCHFVLPTLSPATWRCMSDSIVENMQGTNKRPVVHCKRLMFKIISYRMFIILGKKNLASLQGR